MEERTPRKNSSTLGTLAFLTFGPLVWAAHFLLIYGGHTLACTSHATAQAGYLLVLAATAGATVTILLFLVMARTAANALGVWSPGGDRSAYLEIACVLAGMSLLAVLWGGMTVALVGPCGTAG